MCQEKPSGPWCKFGHVWLVIAGPAVVVVAGIVTVWIAATSPAPVLAQVRQRRPAEITRSAERSLMPAMQGRNHAATPPAAAR
jgi:hypothetical protein